MLHSSSAVPQIYDDNNAKMPHVLLTRSWGVQFAWFELLAMAGKSDCSRDSTKYRARIAITSDSLSKLVRCSFCPRGSPEFIGRTRTPWHGLVQDIGNIATVNDVGFTSARLITRRVATPLP